MTTTVDFIAELELLPERKTFNNKIRSSVSEKFNIIKDNVSRAEKVVISQITEILEKSKPSVSDKKQIPQLVSKAVDIVNKYEEYYNDEDNEDDVEAELTVEQVEELLDEKVDIYCGFSEERPMRGVAWNDKISLYNVKRPDLKINTMVKNKNDACQRIISHVISTGLIGQNAVSNFLVCRGYYFIVYQQENDTACYFDIRHVISTLNLKKTSSNEKYATYSDQILLTKWHQNKFGGYILRELIDEKTMYNIILSSNSKLSKQIKNDVSKMLVELRQSNNLQIDKNGIALKATLPTPTIHTPYTYSSNLVYVHNLVADAVDFPIVDYTWQHVLYAFIMPIAESPDQIVIKFGYSENIIDRYGSLATEYNSKIYLIKIKVIDGQSVERAFHNKISAKYPELIYRYSIKHKNKVELYKFNPVLLTEFDNYHNVYTEPDSWDQPFESKQITVADNVRTQLSKFEYFSNNGEKIRYEHTIELIKKDIEMLKSQTKSEIEILTSQKNSEIEILTSQKDILMSQKDKEIECLEYKLRCEKELVESKNYALELQKELIESKNYILELQKCIVNKSKCDQSKGRK